MLYISFINGYDTNPTINITEKEKKKWEDKWQDEYKQLKISKELEKNIYHVYIDCHMPKKPYNLPGKRFK